MSTTAPVRPDPADTLHRNHPGLALAVIATAQLMVVLDVSIVNIALPHIKTELGFSQTGLVWVLNAYTLVFGGLLLLGGRSGDLFGRRRMFIIGVSLFALASLLGGFAPTKGLLLAARALQGVGGAIAAPTALALVTTTFQEGPARNRAFGVYAAASGAGGAIGLILGGVLTDYLSWRWVFFVNAPIGLALALAARRVLPESERRAGARLDLPGAVTSTLGLTSLVYGFIHAASDGWRDTVTLLSFGVAAVLLAVFVAIEARTAQPLMPLRLFRSRTRVGSYVVMLITGAALFSMFFFLTQYVQGVKGYSPLKAGFAFLPVTAIVIVVAQVASRLVGRVGPRPLISVGAFSMGAGLLWLSQLSVTSSYAELVLPAIALIATGMGLIFVPITLGAVSGVAPGDSGIASAMLNVGQQVGGTLGLSALVTVFSTGFADDVRDQLARLAAHGGGAAPTPGARLPQPVFAHAFTHGSGLAFTFGALFMAIALLAAVSLIRVPAAVARPAPALAD